MKKRFILVSLLLLIFIPQVLGDIYDPIVAQVTTSTLGSFLLFIILVLSEFVIFNYANKLLFKFKLTKLQILSITAVTNLLSTTIKYELRFFGLIQLLVEFIWDSLVFSIILAPYLISLILESGIFYTFLKSYKKNFKTKTPLLDSIKLSFLINTLSSILQIILVIFYYLTIVILYYLNIL